MVRERAGDQRYQGVRGTRHMAFTRERGGRIAFVIQDLYVRDIGPRDSYDELA